MTATLCKERANEGGRIGVASGSATVQGHIDASLGWSALLSLRGFVMPDIVFSTLRLGAQVRSRRASERRHLSAGRTLRRNRMQHGHALSPLRSVPRATRRHALYLQRWRSTLDAACSLSRGERIIAPAETGDGARRAPERAHNCLTRSPSPVGRGENCHLSTPVQCESRAASSILC